jgi:hypothetical protein
LQSERFQQPGLSMGRHRSPLKQALDIKSRLFAASRLLTLELPVLRRFFSFYPDRALPENDRVRVIHRSIYRHPWMGPEFAAQRDFVLTHNVDAYGPSFFVEKGATERFVAEVSNVIVPGHRVTPVDPVTGNQIASDFLGSANFSTARPSISALTRHRMSDDYTIVIPRMDHFGHLLTDWILPAFFAVQQAGLKAGDRLNVVTSDHPVSLITAFVEALRHAGFQVTHRPSRLTETIVVPRLLYANCHTNSIYHRFCTPEVLDFAREHLLAVLPPVTRALPKRIYLDRGRTRVRHVEHEDRLVALLEAQGFERFTGRWSNLAEQIAIFSQVETVVGIHSGGMANMLWSGPQALFVEITAEDARESTALHWCSAVGARYRMLLGSPERELQNFTIDPDTVFASIMAEMAVHQGSGA